MKLLNQLIPALSALAIFILLQSLISAPKNIFYVILAAVLLTVFSIWRLTGQKLMSGKFWRFLITPLLFMGSAVAFYIFLEGPIFRRLFVLGVAVLLFAYLEIIFLRFHYRPKYEPYSLENITVHLDLLAIFFAASSFFSLMLFLNTNFWLLALLFVGIGFLAAGQLIWASGLTLAVGWPPAAILVLLTGEVFYVVSFLPTSVYVNGLIVALAYYFFSGLIRNWLLDIRESLVIKRYLIVSLVCLIIILLTAKWI